MTVNDCANRGTPNVKARTILCQATVYTVEGQTTIPVAWVTASIDTVLEVPSCHLWQKIQSIPLINIGKPRVSKVDMDNSAKDRDKLKFWMLNDHLDLPNVKTCEIITFNTIALKGAIRDIGRGLDMHLDEVDMIAKAVHEVVVDEEKIVTIDDSWRKKYPELFKYVDIVIGTIVSIGSHPSGVVVSDHDIESEFGLCYLKDDPYPVSCINMKELDSLNFTKQDALG